MGLARREIVAYYDPMEKQNKTKRIPVQMSEREYEILLACAERGGMGLSTWLRSLGLREAAKNE